MEKEKEEGLKSKIAALIAKAESSKKLGNLHEAEAFFKKANDLISKYNIDNLDLTKEEKAKAMLIKFETVERPHESDWIGFLINGVSRANFCYSVIDNSRKAYAIIGTPENADTVSYLVIQLIPRIRQMALDAFRKYDGHLKRNTYKRGFLRGAAMGIGEKLREQTAKMQEDARRASEDASYAAANNLPARISELPAVMAKNQTLIRTFLNTHYPRLSRGSSAGLSGKQGFHDGHAAGKSMNIHQGVGGRSMNTRQLN